MRMDKLTSKFQLALADAQSLAVGLDHQLIEPDHVMVALLDQEGGSVRHLLTRAGVKVNALRSQLGERLDSLPKISGLCLRIASYIMSGGATLTLKPILWRHCTRVTSPGRISMCLPPNRWRQLHLCGKWTTC